MMSDRELSVSLSLAIDTKCRAW